MNLFKQLLVVAFTVVATRQMLPQTVASPLPSGQVIESVACAADASETYALYLPSTYTAARRWPILYAFDPMARGRVPVQLYKDVAEKYGYILVGSNTSRNFSVESAAKGANAMWQDTHVRFSLDPRQIYTTGFSGGARVAGLVATSCSQCRVAGVVSFGAGYGNDGTVRPKDSLLYFFGVGDQDFNWPEVIQIRHDREDAGQPYRVHVFPGPHQWGPAPVMEEAVEWFQLKAMQSGTVPPDDAFISQRWAKLQAEAAEAAQKGNAIAQLSALRSLVSGFSGLRDITEEARKLDAVKHSSALKTALKNEDDQIAQQASSMQSISSKIDQLEAVGIDQRVLLRTEIVNAMVGLKDRADHAKNEQQQLVLRRTFYSLWANGIESGQAQVQQKHWAPALDYFQLMADISPEEPWPCLLLAETAAAMGDKKQAIKHVREAVRRGLKNPDVLQNDPALLGLRNEAEYQKLIAQLKTK